MNAISRLATAPLRWWRRSRKARSEGEDIVYNCFVAQESPGWLVIEMRWADLLHFLKSRPRFNSLPDDVIKANLDFSQTTVHPNVLCYNPSVRIRKGNRSDTVPVTIAGPVERHVYFLSIRKLTLVHVERQFRFNLMTWPPVNALPFLVGAGLFALWGIYDEWQLHKSDDFFTVVAVVASLTALAFTLWRLIVQESDKRHDSLCRRLEHELMAHNTAQLSNSVGQVLKFLQDHSGSRVPSQPSPGSPTSSRAGRRRKQSAT